MWRPDGTGWRARIGLLSAHIDVAPESEMWAMAPKGVSIHVTRVPLKVAGPDGAITAESALDGIRAFAAPPLVDDAAELLSGAAAHVIVYGFTSSSYLLGADGDTALKARLQERTGGIPVVVPCLSAVLALRAFGVTRIALIDPPWFPHELNRQGAEYFQSQGFEAVYHSPAEVRDGPGEVYPAQIYDWARRNVPSEAEAVVIGGTGLRVIGAIEALEEDLGRPVLTANQVALWEALHVAGVRTSISGYGEVLGGKLAVP